MATETQAVVVRLQADHLKLKRDLARATRELRRHEAQNKRIMRNIQSQVTSAFGAFTAISLAGGAISSIANFEMQMSKLSAVSGATGQDLKDLKNNALELGAKSKYTATQIGEMQEALARLGFEKDQILASTDAVRKLATVADSEMSAAAETMAGTLNSFNLEATESERIANVMAESFAASALNLEKYTVATANSGAIANTFGITVEQNTARISKLVDANIDASKAGTDLRKIYLELNKAGIDYDEAMQMILSSSDQAGTAQELFGDRAAAAAVILANQRDEVDLLTRAYSDNKTELDSMVEIMEDNLLTDWDKFKSAIDGVVQSGGGVTEGLRAIIQSFTWLINNAENIRNMWQAQARGLGNLIRVGMGLRMIDFRKQGKDLKEGLIGPAPTDTGILDVINETTRIVKELGKQAKTTEEEVKKLVTPDRIWVNPSINDPGPVASSEIEQTGLWESYDRWKEALDRRNAMIQAKNAQARAYFNGLADIAAGTIMDVFSSIASGIGSGQNPFANINQLLGDGLIAIGRYMIMYSTVMEDIRAALTSGFAGIGGGFAAGLLAIAVGSAIKGRASSMAGGGSGGGGGGGRGGGGRGGFTGTLRGQTINMNIVGKISGRDIQLAGSRDVAIGQRIGSI